MKGMPTLLVMLGVIVLFVALLSRFMGPHTQVMGIRNFSFLVLSNTIFSLAILAKLFEKK